MDMYVRMFDDLKRRNDDNPTIGIIFCTDKDETMVKYSVLQESQQIVDLSANVWQNPIYSWEVLVYGSF